MVTSLTESRLEGNLGLVALILPDNEGMMVSGLGPEFVLDSLDPA